MSDTPFGLAPTETPEQGTFEAIFAALEASSLAQIGPARPRLLVIPIHTDAGKVAGGFWGSTLFEWLRVDMLFVPPPLRLLGVGRALMALAEREAAARGCRGGYVDAFSFQAAPFYRKLGYRQFGELEDFPPGHSRLYFCKHFETSGARA